MVIFVIGVAEFLVGVVRNLGVLVVQIIEVVAKPGADALLLHVQGALDVLNHIAVRRDGHAAIRVDFAFEDIAEDKEFDVAVLVGRHVARQGEDFLVTENLVFLDGGFDHQIGRALAQIAAGVELGIGKGTEQDHAGLVDIADQGLPLHAAEGTGRRGRSKGSPGQDGDSQCQGRARRRASHQ